MDEDFNESGVNINVLLRNTNNEVKSNKCNQCNYCDFASSLTDHLRRHLKTHSGEKPRKVEQMQSM